MSVKSKITTNAQEILCLRIPRNARTWLAISSLCQAYGQDEVADTFEKWARNRAEVLTLTTDQFGDFVREADELLNLKHKASKR
jgi:hypothetical protein